jgi:excisionase family DNA binding protein
MTITIHFTDEQMQQLADSIAERMRVSHTDEKPLTVEEAAKRLRVSESTINRRIKAGTIPTVPGLGRSLIPASAVKELLEGRIPTKGGDGE